MSARAVLFLGLTVALYAFLSLYVGAERGAPVSEAPSPSDVAGFGADTWHLPDEPLLGFVEIVGGPFTMGSDRARDPLAYDNELWPGGGPGEADVAGFYIGRYEVTVAQYAAFVRDTDHAVAPEALGAPPDHPVASVSWPDALAYAAWLEERLRGWVGAPPELADRLAAGWRVTLPTEAQWEKAARGSDGRVLPWGDEALRGAAHIGARGPAPVGRTACPGCAHGLSDMIGNVWEWTRSPLQPYPYDPSDDRETVEQDALWVMRGGSYTDAVQNARAATRGGADPGARRPFIGFRVVIAPE